MAKILYRARDAAGNKKQGYIEAATLEAAREALLAKGLSDPQFFNEPGVAALREDLASLSPAQAQQQAAFELRIRERPGYSTFIRELLRRQRWLLAIDAVLLLWGLWSGDGWLCLAAVLLFAGSVLWPIWKFRDVQRYNDMLRSFALGEWSRALALISELKAGGGKPLLMRSDFAFREAYIHIRSGETTLALETERLDRLHAELEASAPGMFDMRYASLCAAANDGAGVVAAMRRALLLNSSDSSRLVDVANSEARFGSIEQAEAVLKKAQDCVQQEMAQPFIDWTRGLIALRRNQSEAETHLAEAMRGFMVYAANPAVLGAVGLCGGAYAIALARNGRRKEARDVVRQVSPVLKAHGDHALMTLLRFEMKKAEGAKAEV
ncbi:hypothetical protein [Uliginosibacterium sp. 31-12]|uniref:hypothetical protein n=1 Tax=Uliginosibacterium sp. 31-12 TaxID=3062781 RepID=UPI0026E27CE0|nr:hypothetical protein [Uliginosibacterium sp. 31-12]MDO6384775.1 hypothetical protein [Uliginosibacterium sp. 31-12]